MHNTEVLAAISTPVRRITFAIALSAMIHATLLWFPHLSFVHHTVSLPPLTVRIEHLPSPLTQPALKPQANNLATKSEINLPGKQTSSLPHTLTTKLLEKSSVSLPFPKHIQLFFTGYQLSESTKPVKLHQLLDIDGFNYSLKSIKQDSALINPGNKENVTQISQGQFDEQGFRPEVFGEKTISEHGTQVLHVTFSWATHTLHFSGGENTPLSTGAQDILSFMYQLSQLAKPPLQTEYFKIPISNGTQLEQVQIEIGISEDISTPMGNLRALHLRKMHTQNEPYFEIWLGLEYRMLPVKFRQVDASGETIEEDVISDIRASDE
jgi:hypothetical protein